MTNVQSGNTVKVHFRGFLDDGTEFDSTSGRPPMEVEVGGGRLVPAFETALIGMAIGESKTVSIAAADAYGDHQAALVQTLARNEIPAEIALELGAVLQATTPQGEALKLTVVGLTDDDVVLDANHPLAGHNLTFEIEVVAIG